MGSDRATQASSASSARLNSSRVLPATQQPLIQLASLTEETTQNFGSAGGSEATELLLLGSWEDDYRGHRVLTLQADGTGTMLVELSGAARILFAARLSFRLAWTHQDGILTLRMLGGEPEKKIALIIRNYGDRSEQEILSVSREHLCVRDLDDGDEFEWRRVSSAP